MSGPRDECGIVGVMGPERAAEWAYLGLYARQHRGQESSGIVSADGARSYAHRGMGLVSDVFDEEILTGLPGAAAIGHKR